MVERALVEKYGGGVIIMGCAGAAGHRAPLEVPLAVPAIDPTLAAVAIAIGVVQPAHP
jgi:allantoin racemase